MGSGIVISPSVMITRMAHEAGVPEPAQLLEVARLRAEMMQARSENAASPLPTTAPTEMPVNGAEVDLLV